MRLLEDWLSFADCDSVHTQPAITETRKTDRRFKPIRKSHFKPADEPSSIDADTTNAQYSLDEIIKIYDAARACLEDGHSEATWNAWVHQQVLALALGGHGWEKQGVGLGLERGDSGSRREGSPVIRFMPW